MTKLGARRIHPVRTRGGNLKHRALRLESGNYAWGSEHTTRKTRIIGVVYNATNNELVRTNTLVKGCVVQIDAALFRQWYEAHYGQAVVKKGRSKEALAAVTEEADKKSNHVKRTIAERQKEAKVDPLLESQFAAGPVGPRRRLHPRGQGARVLHPPPPCRQVEARLNACGRFVLARARRCRGRGDDAVPRAGCVVGCSGSISTGGSAETDGLPFVLSK